MSGVQFVDAVPYAPHSRGQYADFFAELHDNEGRWAIFRDDYKNPKTAYAATATIRACKYLGQDKNGKYEAASRTLRDEATGEERFVAYVRYLGSE